MLPSLLGLILFSPLAGATSWPGANDLEGSLSFHTRRLMNSSDGSEFSTDLEFTTRRFENIQTRDSIGTCSDSVPCSNGACCSVSGYCGYSPEFCGTGNCTSNCDATAECGQYAAKGSTDCPLNVCCSQYGFCGTTSDFCGTGCQSDAGSCGDVTEPSCSGSSATERIIAYYESWSPERPCGTATPDQLNLVGFTHANLAFAYFDPGTFAITAMDQTMMDSISAFTGLKSNYSSLETWISVGGWSFSDPGATQTAWSDMAASESSRATFITNLLTFMRTYGFDGVDLDWEYPGASDRGGTSEDGENFVSLVKEMRSSFGTKFGISVTLPTSYWYLQGFKPVEMEKYVDWFNLMAYDLHGTWDATDVYVGPYIAPHTNLTEISAALDLLWRAGVTPGKIVLGQGWYGRSFTLADPTCATPNGVCEFTTGGNPGACTQTSGILSNQEIQQIMAEYDVTVVYDETDAVNYMTWDTNQWVSYDNATTYAQKLSFANDLCLGGMMVWAVDLQNQSTKTGYGAQADKGLSDTATDYSNYQALSQQAGEACYTSACGVSCMSGYSAVTNMQGQPGYLPTADDCSGSSVETLCCASGTTLGTCNWRGWRGVGLPCSGGCYSNETLIAQNTNHHDTVNGKTQDQTCNGGLQSYCCSDFKAGSALKSSSSLSLSEDEVDLSPVVSVVVATVTEALANAAKSIIDTVATDFCDVAVPVMLEEISDIELAIPIIGELLIVGEWIAEEEITKECEKLIEDGGDAVLSWLGYTSSFSVSDVTETITETSTGDWYCSPTTCVDACANKIKKKRALRLPAQADAQPTETPAPRLREDAFQMKPRAAGLNSPASGKLDSWAETEVFGNNGNDVSLLDIRGNSDGELSTSGFKSFDTSSPFIYAMKGLEGCTAVVIASHCGVYLAHIWEDMFKPAVTSDVFDTWVLGLLSFFGTGVDDLTISPSELLQFEKWYKEGYFLGIPMVPDGCFTTAEDVKALVFTRTRGTYSAGLTGDDLPTSTTAQYTTQITDIINQIASLIGVDSSAITTQLYTRYRAAAEDSSTAWGKLIVTFSPDVGDGTAAYEVWAGGIIQDGEVIVDDSKITGPIMKDSWTPSNAKAKKRGGAAAWLWDWDASLNATMLWDKVKRFTSVSNLGLAKKT